MTPLPSSRLTLRIVDSEGDAIPGAVAGLLARDARDAAEFVVADSKGMAAFTEVPAGILQFTAHAKGYAPATARVPEDRRTSIVIPMTRIP